MLESMNLAIFVGSVLILAACFTSFLSFRFGAPLLLVFLLVGLVAGEDGLGLHFDNGPVAYFIGSLALAIILFDSGFATPLQTLRAAAAPSVMLSTVGVAATSIIVGAAAHLFFNLTWIESLVLGAIVAPTDAAAVFFLLRVGGITLRERVRATLEVESGSNDPMAIFLTISLTGLAAANASAGEGIFDLVREFVLQIGLGMLFGLAGGFLMREVVNRTHLEPGLYPILLLALALGLFSLSGMMHGSGFLAVYVAGLVAGNSQLRHAVALKRFNEALTWLAQIAMFLILGLLATPSRFVLVLAPAVLLAVVLMLIARPVAIWLCLLPYRFSRHEVAFVAWVGLRGATSVLLSILPMISGVEHGRVIFDVAFIVVLVSLLIQGWSIGPVARWLGLIVPPNLGPIDRIELELPGRGDHEIVAYKVHPESPVGRGGRIPRWARPSLIIRDGHSFRPHNAGRPQSADRVYIITPPRYVPLLDRLFAGPAAGADDAAIYGEFAIDPEARIGDLAPLYEASVPLEDSGLTVRDYLRRGLAGNIERGDRLSLGPVALIVRRVDDRHAIEEVGLAVEPVPISRPRIPLFQSPAEIWAAVRRRLGRPAAGSDSKTAG